MSARSGATSGFYLSGRKTRAADPAPHGAAVVASKPGLERMRDRTPDGLCPFCLDPLKSKRGRTCGDEECVRAYHRTHQRDRRAGNSVRKQKTVSR